MIVVEDISSKFGDQFEQEYEKSENKEKFLYGFRTEEKSIEAAEFVKNSAIETLFPGDLLENIQDFSQAKILYNDVNI